MNLKKHINIYLRMLTLLLVLPEIILQHYSIQHKIISALILALVAIIDIWSYSPWNKKNREVMTEYSTYLIFILVGIFALLNTKTIIILYLYLIVVITAETMVKQHPTQKHLVIIQSLILFIFFSVPAVKYSYWSPRGIVQMIFSPFTIQFWSTFLISYLYINLSEKNRSIDKLNQELTNKVDQLQDYSNKIKELTLIDERQRISQNLHDMLGHSLIGLRLHLDALDHFIDTDTEKSHQILSKSKDIIDHSLVELRETVDELNETKELADLKTALTELQKSISISGKVRVNLNLQFDVNNLDISIKDLIYKTCQETITNSIKHGHSTKIDINIFLESDKLHLTITNNGQSVTRITESNGITGIKQRVKNLNGQVLFSSKKPHGFKTEITIPMGVITHD